MAVLLRLPGGTDDVAEIIDALLSTADGCADRAPALAARRRQLAHDMGDALDQLPAPPQ
ncbi:hypothetical protein [Streptomyces tendae]|uniref:hypothetical protein n=1 Tax=Streptomyces tendae TaxID=1932 RepID=UPI00378BD350